MKKCLVFFCYGESKYFNLVKRTLTDFKHWDQFEVIVYSNDPDRFIEFNVTKVKYSCERFSYHHKIGAIKNAWDLGFKEILFMDSDLIIKTHEFFDEILDIKFESGINYTRNGQPSNLETYLSNKEEYKKKIEHLDLELKSVPSVFEDVLYFNFNLISSERVDSFFDLYEKITFLKHQYDDESGHHRYGDQEGYTIAMSAIKLGIPLNINLPLLYSIRNLRAINYTYDGVMQTILSDIEFIFPYRKDSEEREKNLWTVLDYYRRHFSKNRFIISEQGLNKSKFDEFSTHIFEEKSLPHNQSKCINNGVREAGSNIICVIDSDIILINHYNIYQAVRDMYLGECDYALPYTECVDLPDFEFRRPWGNLCIGGIFIIDREKFISLGMNDESFEGWGREDDARHEKLISSGMKFKRYHGNIVHLWHPQQDSKGSSAETNMRILDKIRNDLSNSNQIQKGTSF